MVKIDEYSEDFCDEFYKCVEEHLVAEGKTGTNSAKRKRYKDIKTQQLEQRIVSYAKKLFNLSEFSFRKLVLMPYSELEKNYLYMEANRTNTKNVFATYQSDFDEMVKAYKRVAESRADKMKMNVRMVKETGLYVCPYCNRSYISSRGGEVSGAQLDHFFPKADYPIFALSLYNLVPSCGDCNRVKSKNKTKLLSPFDHTVDWNVIKFSYIPRTGNNVITIEAPNPEIQNNIDEMKIKEAYQIHGAEVYELLEKKQMYEKSQIKEFDEVLKKIHITETDYKKLIFGPQITDEMLKKMPLGRLKRDLQKELQIYP